METGAKEEAMMVSHKLRSKSTAFPTSLLTLIKSAEVKKRTMPNERMIVNRAPSSLYYANEKRGYFLRRLFLMPKCRGVVGYEDETSGKAGTC